MQELPPRALTGTLTIRNYFNISQRRYDSKALLTVSPCANIVNIANYQYIVQH